MAMSTRSIVRCWMIAALGGALGGALSGALLSARAQPANLVGRDLRAASLAGADLAGANLAGANLLRANLSRANLQGADLRGARYDRRTKWPEGFDPRRHGTKLVAGPSSESDLFSRPRS